MDPKAYREQLIEEVKKHPVLYDTKHENHRDIEVRDRCWMEISERIGENSEILKREWKILRDSYRQAIKTNKHTKRGMLRKVWRFQHRMAFIMPYMTKRNLPRQAKQVVKMEECMGQSDAEQETEVWDPGHGDQDSLDLFFASVCVSTKRLPRKYQNQIKKQILDILFANEEEFESDQNQSKTEYRSFTYCLFYLKLSHLKPTTSPAAVHAVNIEMLGYLANLIHLNVNCLDS